MGNRNAFPIFSIQAMEKHNSVPRKPAFVSANVGYCLLCTYKPGGFCTHSMSPSTTQLFSGIASRASSASRHFSTLTAAIPLLQSCKRAAVSIAVFSNEFMYSNLRSEAAFCAAFATAGSAVPPALAAGAAADFAATSGFFLSSSGLLV